MQYLLLGAFLPRRWPGKKCTFLPDDTFKYFPDPITGMTMPRGQPSGGSDAASGRYCRQIPIPGWGVRGQRKLGRSSIMVAGVGGLGSAAAALLVKAGAGHLRIVDSDLVETSNTNRQLLHWEVDLGFSKAASALEKLRRMNSEVEIEALPFRITEENVDDLLEGVDGVVDGLDNFEARYLLNRRAVEMGFPFYHGSIYALEGRATTILPGRSPCLRCIYEMGPPPGPVPAAGPIPAMVGSIQAMEAIKFTLGLGKLLDGRILVIDGEDMTFSEIEVVRNPSCPVCGEGPTSA
jgi:molybdopterin/thiamine biosynthesis adenylyltransferase